VIRLILHCGASGIVGGEELDSGERARYKHAHRFHVVHPLRQPPPQFEESDGCAGIILHFRLIRRVIMPDMETTHGTYPSYVATIANVCRRSPKGSLHSFRLRSGISAARLL